MTQPAIPPADRPQPKPWIAAIHPYVPGKSTGTDGAPLIKLSANENPLGTGPLAQAARAQAGDQSRYPDPDSVALRQAIARLHAITVDRVVMGTGSDELLNLAAQAFAGPGDDVVYVRYAFRCTTLPRGAAEPGRWLRPIAITAHVSICCWRR